MSMNPGQFLLNLNRIVTGHGFLKALPIDLLDAYDPAGAPLTTISSGDVGIEVLDTEDLAVQFKANTTDKHAVYKILIPPDYDKSNDYLRFRMLAEAVHASDITTKMDIEVYKRKAGTALGSDLAPATTTLTAMVGAAEPVWTEITLDSLGLGAGDVLTIHVIPEAHANGVVNMYAVEVIYKSDIVYYDDASR